MPAFTATQIQATTPSSSSDDSGNENYHDDSKCGNISSDYSSNEKETEKLFITVMLVVMLQLVQRTVQKIVLHGIAVWVQKMKSVQVGSIQCSFANIFYCLKQWLTLQR